MKNTPLWLSLALVVLASGASAQGMQSHRLGWLQGCWATVNQDRAVEEQWMAPRGKTMIGTSRTVQGTDLVTYEFMIIREQGGTLSLEVRPSGKPPVVYSAASITDSSVLFENAKREFPQKIGYRRNGDNAMVAWIEGHRDGELRRAEFLYRQVLCAGD